MHAFDSPRERAQLLLAVLGVVIAMALTPLVTGLLGGVVLYIAVAPLHRRLRVHIPARAAAVIAVVVATALILVPIGVLVVIAVERAPAAMRQLQDSTGLARLAAIRINGIDVGTRALEASGQLVSWVSSQAFRVLGGAVRGTLNAVVALFGLYFLLRSAPAAWRAAASYLPFSAFGAYTLAERFRQVTEATLLGTALTAILQGAVVALGFAVTELPDAWFWGTVTAMVSVLPVFGSALVWGPGVVALLMQERYDAAMGLLAIGVVVASNIDNVMRPLVNRRVSNLHPMTTVVGAFAGVGVLGLPGILLGPLAITYFFELVKLYRREYGPGKESGEPVAESLDMGRPALGTLSDQASGVR